jgi:isoaspartyl peptidase/L-asparaginase-like protein (Ntn-hydrolase superfamily)
VPDAGVAGPRVDRPARASLGPIVVAHAGQGSPAGVSDGPEVAAKAALAVLVSGGGARDAAVEGVRLLEDDPRFNAGTGANLRMDGTTHECDAAVMDDEGRFAAIAGIDGIRNPVLAAAAVADTPHRLLAGAGAQAFADGLGLARASLTTQRARDAITRAMTRLLAGDPPSGWAGFDWRARWNYATPAPTSAAIVPALTEAPAAVDASDRGPTGGPAGRAASGVRGAAEVAAAEATTPPTTPTDTVGLVVRTADGRYAAALSTGGTALALRGRIGDVPLEGHGLFAGPHGAVAATGKGEAIVREQVARGVYEQLRRGVTPEQAIRVAIRGISDEEGVGVIAVSDRGWAAIATSSMAWAAATPDASIRADPAVAR